MPKKLLLLDINELSSLIAGFWKKSKIFQSEAQFQFELAWELKKYYDCEVFLEDLTMIINISKGKSQQKVYTDIVLEKGDYRVAIELKYKTAPLIYGSVMLFKHGATDLGRFDYLWDVHRLELLASPTTKVPLEKKQIAGMTGIRENDVDIKVIKKCDKGFAILLTNEISYWEKSYNKCSTIDSEFCFAETDSRLYDKVLDWKKTVVGYPKTVVGTFRGRSINLLKAYGYQWKQYCKVVAAKNNEFKYIIIETNREKS